MFQFLALPCTLSRSVIQSNIQIAIQICRYNYLSIDFQEEMNSVKFHFWGLFQNMQVVMAQ